MRSLRILFVTTLLSTLLVACGQRADPGERVQPSDLPEDLRTGRWGPVPPSAPAGELTAEQRAEIERLRAIGYAGGVRAAPGVDSVTVHDPARALPGLNLYTSGHAAEALLVDMNGRVLHRWQHDYERLWPEMEVPEDTLGQYNWRRVHLYPNGDLLAIHEGIGLIRLDRDSRLLWQFPGLTHHDIDVTPDGSIWTLSREVGIIPRIDPEEPSIEDLILRLSPEGELLERWSLLEIIERTGGELLELLPPYGNLTYVNSLEMLDDRPLAWLPPSGGRRALVSLRRLDAIAILDLDAGEVVWSLTGDFRGQHDPTLLDDGTLLLFDNLGPGDQRSAVHEIDPATGEVVWEYRGSEARPFYSRTCGTSYRLANGNTLITESDGGRAFEVTPGGEIVWEYYNPHRAGDELQYIASLYDLRRFPASYVSDWLDLAP